MTTTAHTLDAYVNSSSSQKYTPLAESQEIRDRGSIFSATIFRAQSPTEARNAIAHLKRFIHAERPAYEIAAWRCMILKSGKNGLGGPDDFELAEGYDDGGEKGAGIRVLSTMRREGIVDNVVIVSRWFGGTMLGPVRFSHIEICAGEVCKRLRKTEEMEECLSTLRTLDDLLADLREEFAKMTEPTPKPIDTSDAAQESLAPKQPKAALRTKKPDYSSLESTMDLARARRLVTAREGAIKSVKTMIEKKRKEGSHADMRNSTIN
ncbi:ribosomal protein S5 domain 2-like protein [Coniophora puteana RWD-64-598 SS2]|uniref:Ribosomal protein S5 domain 2-like protein n=1 Tax=Coniophora puteana (strain RWD-64-598) TaxID=741705 RepID=A0A5M3MNL5_CONPW|nr:ribosomal protein S5 domain 2-like protein [Coniophora puteana RWD-64-598 SS2]EIW80384.1 ribosomal protein S5 domain 2-like protein [Coniophora puteana RWD-64-598 SS2]